MSDFLNEWVVYAMGWPINLAEIGIIVITSTLVLWTTKAFDLWIRKRLADQYAKKTMERAAEYAIDRVRKDLADFGISFIKYDEVAMDPNHPLTRLFVEYDKRKKEREGRG